MSLAPLKVAFLWHMHQPWYKDPRTLFYRLPWVRLHATKDYFDMVARLEAFPRLKANFNLVPILVEQILDYASGTAGEVQLELARKSPDALTEEEKLALVKDSFLGNRKKMIEPYSRYRSLLDKCPDLKSEYKIRSTIRKCSSQDFLDLQVWSNLVWIDPFFEGDPLVRSLHEKGRHFTDREKDALLDKQAEIIRGTIPKYRELADSGRIEISFSPYYHPILPILCDAEVARRSMPGAALPVGGLRVPEDAEIQIALGSRYHEQIFGRVPAGMWPPEGAVSDEVLALACKGGVRWLATDEAILERTAGVSLRDRASMKVTRPDLLYRPHRFRCDGGEVTVFFRDKTLSDLISFRYMALPAEDAADDFVGRLESIRKDLGEEVGSSVVVVALDGENCWEFYDRDGADFLNRLYGRLECDDGIETVLLSQVLAEEGDPSLSGIYPGSWINSNFSIWIGGLEDNTGWDMLLDARARLAEKERDLSDEDQHLAWQSVYAAEGSDWFWWYGSEHYSRHSAEYDSLFRSHIRRIHDLLGEHTPSGVLCPITAHQKGPALVFEPAAIMKPILDGRITTFYEWRLAGLYESYRDVSRHTPVAPVVTAVHFGFDRENLYVRIDTKVSPQGVEFTQMAFRLEFDCPVEREITFRAEKPCSPESIELMVEPRAQTKGARAVALETIEAAVPFDLLGARPGDRLSFRVAVVRKGTVAEHRPFHEMITLTVPSADFDAQMWGTL